jgi:predicted  nucleic acid-binding Zn-ribbon protein
VSEDDRQRRRLGDATRDKIANLADGWSVPGQAGGTTPDSAKSARPLTDPAEAVSTLPFDRAPDDEDSDLDRTDDGFGEEQQTDVAPPSREALEILRGDAVRRSDSEIQRSITSLRATRGPPPPPPGAKRPTSPPPTPSRPARIERDDDATTIEPPQTFAHATPTHGAVREPPSLPRTRGLAGDLGYVFTVISGVRRAKRELLEAEDQITTLKAERASRLAELGRAAVSDDRFDQTAIRSSRDLLTDIEDRRSRHAGAAAAADAELDAIERSRQSQLNKLADAVADAEAGVQRLDGLIGPLERESAAVRKRAAQVKETLSSIDSRIAAARASLVSVKGPEKDAAGVEAELASLRADRASVSRDEPAIAAELDALLPRIANLESQRADAQARITAARTADAEARMRAEEQVTAVQARRRVENRAAADARTASERALVELGERLYVERPDDLTIKLGAVDKQDVSIATSQRRAIELRELLGSVDRAALARGIALWLAIVAAVVTTVVVVLT